MGYSVVSVGSECPWYCSTTKPGFVFAVHSFCSCSFWGFSMSAVQLENLFLVHDLPLRPDLM